MLTVVNVVVVVVVVVVDGGIPRNARTVVMRLKKLYENGLWVLDITVLSIYLLYIIRKYRSEILLVCTWKASVLIKKNESY